CLRIGQRRSLGQRRLGAHLVLDFVELGVEIGVAAALLVDLVEPDHQFQELGLVPGGRAQGFERVDRRLELLQRLVDLASALCEQVVADAAAEGLLESIQRHAHRLLPPACNARSSWSSAGMSVARMLTFTPNGFSSHTSTRSSPVMW